jgi:hypothetical protein
MFFQIYFCIVNLIVKYIIAHVTYKTISIYMISKLYNLKYSCSSDMMSKIQTFTSFEKVKKSNIVIK